MSRQRDPLALVEQLAVAEEIASIVRHDLRNRLGAIRNAGYFLKRRVSTTELWANEPRVPKFFGLIEDEVVAADALIHAKLALAQLRERCIAELSVARCMDVAAGAARVEAEIELAVPSDLRVSGDLEELAVALRALIENAAESHEHARVRLEAARFEDRARLVIIDDGPGLSDLDRAMRPTFTTKPGRVGLGLNVAERIARRHGGSISLGPTERGARLCLELPAVP